jgi:hypothetical protein
MGSMLKFDSDRRELVRERRQARMERKAQRREDRERKRTTTDTTPIPAASMTATPSPAQRAAERQVRERLDRIVEHALHRHDQPAATVSPVASSAPTAPDSPARRPAPGLGLSGSSPPHRARRPHDRSTPTSCSPSTAPRRTGSGVRDDIGRRSESSRDVWTFHIAASAFGVNGRANR